MTKKELIQRMCRDCHLTQAQANRALRSVAQHMATGLRRGGRVQLSGLGSFAVIRSSGGTGRNPQTGNRVRLRHKASVRFTPAKTLAKKVC